MARKTKDVFGFDEIQKAFDKMQGRYNDKATAMIAAGIRQAKKRVKQQTPKLTGNLRKGWKEKKPKDYQNGRYKVGLLYNDAPHAHLYERGHKQISHGKQVGSVEGRDKLGQTLKELELKVLKDAEKLMDEITKDVQL